MKTGLSTNVLKARRDSRIKNLSGSKAFIEGSLKEIKVKCGNPNCRCANGEKHTSHILTRKVNGKTKSVYVPVGMVKEVEKWVEEYRKIKTKIREITEINEQIIRQHVKVNRAVGKNLKHLNQQQQT